MDGVIVDGVGVGVSVGGIRFWDRAHECAASVMSDSYGRATVACR